MSDLSEISPGEVLEVVQRLFPLEFRVAVLTLANDRQAQRVNVLESALSAALPTTGTTETPGEASSVGT